MVDETLLGTARTLYRLGFANFRDIVAYEDNQANFWVADLMNIHPILLLSAPGKVHDELLFTWTPDDQHLIIDFDNPEQPDLIFHLQTGKWDIWDYVCDRLSFSPQSQKLAIWCISSSNSTFAIIEWGGELWYSDQQPEGQAIISSQTDDNRFRAFPIYRNAGWSSDGELIAYYDPQDENGNLTIINLSGDIQHQVPEKAYWLTDYYQMNPYLPGLPIQWSMDGLHLLILGIGDHTTPCSAYNSTLDNRIYHNPGCWQVIEVATGDIEWQDSNLSSSTEPALFIRNLYQEATISRNGAYISLYNYFPADTRFYIVEVDTGNILYNRAWSIFRMRWGATP